MCALIFAAMAMKDKWRPSFDPFGEWIGEETDIQENMSDREAYHIRSEYSFNGKHVACFCCYSVDVRLSGTSVLNVTSHRPSCRSI